MERLYERAITLLGKGPDDQSMAEFILASGEAPTIFFKTDSSTEYCFEKYQILATFLKCRNCFSALYFCGKHLTEPTNFPAGIQFGDTSSAVEQKLGVKLTHDGSLSDASPHQASNIRLQFFYDKSTHLLNLIVANYIPALDNSKIEDCCSGCCRNGMGKWADCRWLR